MVDVQSCRRVYRQTVPLHRMIRLGVLLSGQVFRFRQPEVLGLRACPWTRLKQRRLIHKRIVVS